MCQERKLTPNPNEERQTNAPPVSAAKDAFFQEFCYHYCKFPCMCFSQDDLDYQCYELCDLSLRLDKVIEAALEPEEK